MGNLYVVGRTMEESRDQDIWCRKYTRSGGELWTFKHSGALGGHDHGRGVAVDAIGDVYVVGTEHDPGSGADNARLLKLDPAGNLIWSRLFDSGEDDTGWAVAVDAELNVVVGGTSHADGNNTAWVSRYDRDGNRLWHQDGPVGSELGALSLRHLGGITAAGFADGLWIASFHNSGELESEMVLEDFYFGRALAPAGNGDVIVNGTGNDGRMSVRRYSESGEPRWSWNSERESVGFGMAIREDGSLVAVGSDTESLSGIVTAIVP